MKKKLLFVSVSIVLVLLFQVGCFNNEPEQKKTSGQVSSGLGNFPSGPITIVNPWNAGGGADAATRLFEKLAPKYIDQPILVVNKPGAGGTIATAEYLQSEADGYTVLFNSSGVFTSQPFMTDVQYKLEDFTALVGMLDSSLTLAVNANTGIESLEQLLEKFSQPGERLVFGHSGTGSMPHLNQQTLYKIAGITARDIPYNGAAESIPALLGNHVDTVAQGTSEFIDLERNGDVNVLGIFANESMAGFPTLKEQGYDVALSVWRMLLVKKETPDEIVAYLTDLFSKMLRDPEYVEYAERFYLSQTIMDHQQVVDRIGRESAIIESALKELKLGKFSE